MSIATLILKDLGFSEQQALRAFALLNASQKVAEYEQENQFFQRKYNATFSEFEREIQSSNEEVFEQEDDYMAWKFVVEGLAYWQEKVEELRREL
jgi:hypothetical protein